jgi:hypothetical protein
MKTPAFKKRRLKIKNSELVYVIEKKMSKLLPSKLIVLFLLNKQYPLMKMMSGIWKTMLVKFLLSYLTSKPLALKQIVIFCKSLQSVEKLHLQLMSIPVVKYLREVLELMV